MTKDTTAPKNPKAPPTAGVRNLEEPGVPKPHFETVIEPE
jgi:hypothetical protein